MPRGPFLSELLESNRKQTVAEVFASLFARFAQAIEETLQLPPEQQAVFLARQIDQILAEEAEARGLPVSLIPKSLPG